MKSNKNLSELSALSGLPNGWKWVKLGDVGEVVAGGTPSTKIKEYFDGNIAWITPADLTGYKQKYISKGRRNISEEGLKNSSARIVPKGSILFSSRAPIGYVAIALNELCTNQGFKNLIPNKNVDSEFVYYFLKSAKQLAEKNASGTTFNEISAKNFANLPIPLPPLDEQKKIVEKIEELFSQLDSGVAALKKAKEQLRLYRQSVLAAAFSGSLNQDLSDSKINRIKSKQKSDESSTPVNHGSDNLPNGWKWVKVSNICKKIIGGGTPSTKISEYWVGDIDWITSADIYGIKDVRPRKKVNQTAIKNSATNLLPKGNIVVVTRVGLGKIALNKNDLCFSQDSQGLILNGDLVFNEYALWYLFNAVQEFKYKNRGTTINGVTKKQLAELNFLLPPKNEQHQIVEEIEKRFSEADNLEKAIDESLAKAETLRQSILKQAFEGKLV